MKRGLRVALFVVLFVGLLFTYDSRTDTAQATESTIWSGGFSVEEIDETRTFKNGHPCEERELHTYSYFSAPYIFTPYWTQPKQTDKVNACGFSSNYGFVDAENNYRSEDGLRAERLHSAFYFHRLHPGSLFLHTRVTSSLSGTYSLSYTHDNIYESNTYLDAKKGRYSGYEPLMRYVENTDELEAVYTPIDYVDSAYPNGRLLHKAWGTSENGQYIATSTTNGVFLVDTYANTIQLISDIYPQYESGGIAVSNDGKTILHVGESLRYPSERSGSLRMLIHHTSGCSGAVALSEFSRSTDMSRDGCETQDLLGDVESLVGSASRDVYLNDPDSTYIHPRQRYAQFSLRTTPRPFGDSRTLTVRLTPHNAPKANGYLAMGDSFSSGEGDLQGAEWYEPGTDEQGDSSTFAGRNLCHVSRRSYPYLLAKELGYLEGSLTTPITPALNGEFHSVACSGAKLHNVVGRYGEDQSEGDGDDFAFRDNQYLYDFRFNLGVWQQGAATQSKSLNGDVFATDRQRIFNPEVITLGIGGNDANFSKHLITCAAPGTCAQAEPGSHDAYLLARDIVYLKPRLVSAYQKIKSHSSDDTRIYVHGYPKFVSSDSSPCSNNVSLDAQERIMVSRGVELINNVIKSAAAEAGVYYVDIEDILQDVNLCSGAVQSAITVNGINIGDDKYELLNNIFMNNFCLLVDFTSTGSGCGLGNESYHPNEKGHFLYARSIAELTSNFSAAMPTPQKTDIPAPDEFFGVSTANLVDSINVGSTIPVVSSDYVTVSGVNNGGVDTKLQVTAHNLAPSSQVSVEVHSDPVEIGDYTTNDNGSLQIEFTPPDNLPGGLHNIVISAVNSFGQQVELHEPIFIAQSAEDFDGDGVINSSDNCPVIEDSLVDEDNDGIDDACDSFIEQPEKEGEESINNKDQPSPETVAGTEDELANNQVLGVTTDDTPVTLSATGRMVLVQLFCGLTILISTAILYKRKHNVYAKK